MLPGAVALVCDKRPALIALISRPTSGGVELRRMLLTRSALVVRVTVVLRTGLNSTDVF